MDFELKLNYLVKIEITDFILSEIRDKIRLFLMEKCSGNFYIFYGPSSTIDNNGKYELMDRTYLFIMFEKKEDKAYFKLKWM